ncbi:AraC family transcriptional regulator [Demequina mangrovi]|uniref:Transcriptional regulator, AraC family n=1 Tax=Demequina mangrovi TaxID=1043493 RepID=A0A1H6UZ17_9MICO|nr:AraC family transcriptional regulator [Demequina mangrovi]SEI95894.1 transcriptional regulator, AraC family [Demequina mangrovi]
MSVVGGPVIRRIVDASRGPERTESLLESVGLAPTAAPLDAAKEAVDSEAYYDLLERVTAHGDDDLPLRYASLLRPDDLGALGLGLKTAPTAQGALQRLVRYILVLSDTLEYELRRGERPTLVMSRPSHRRGAQLANECALAAVVSVLRGITGVHLAPESVTFRHAGPASVADHEAFFGCPVRFDGEANAIAFAPAALRTPTTHADEGLSAYLLAELDQLKRTTEDQSLESRIYAAVTDALPDGVPRRAQVALRLGMSERTLHRRLAEEELSFRSIARAAQLDAAEALLTQTPSSLGEIAFLTGFSDQSAFSRAFKAHTGLTPMAYRSSRDSP